MYSSSLQDSITLPTPLVLKDKAKLDLLIWLVPPTWSTKKNVGQVAGFDIIWNLLTDFLNMWQVDMFLITTNISKGHISVLFFF